MRFPPPTLLLALCPSRQQAEQVQARLAAWLAPRGLAFNEDKTRVVHLDDGVDFLGFNVRRYRGKLLIKPSKAAVKRARERLSTEMRALRGHNAQMVLVRLNPFIRGSLGVARLSCNVALEHSGRAFATGLRGVVLVIVAAQKPGQRGPATRATPVVPVAGS